MANFACEFFSDVMQSRCSFNVMIPESCKEEDIPVVFLLHGMGGNHCDWQRLTSVDRYAKERGIALVLPYGGNSFYCDMTHGDPYATYITEELLNYVRRIFPVSKKREKTFVAGMSMGGYGTMKFALEHPDTFGACAAFAGTMDIQVNFQRPDRRAVGTAIWGAEGIDSLTGSKYDIFELLRRCEAEDKLKDLWVYHGCGTEDPLYPQNVKLRGVLEQKQLHYEYHERPGGHTWDIWDYFAEKGMDFFARYLQEHNG